MNLKHAKSYVIADPNPSEVETVFIPPLGVRRMLLRRLMLLEVDLMKWSKFARLLATGDKVQ